LKRPAKENITGCDMGAYESQNGYLPVATTEKP
jgi:hypothetical protein